MRMRRPRALIDGMQVLMQVVHSLKYDPSNEQIMIESEPCDGSYSYHGLPQLAYSCNAHLQCTLAFFDG